jgi:hypothetical protein
MSTPPDGVLEGHALVELLGHRRVAGHVRQVRVGEATMIAVTVPLPEGEQTALYGLGAIYGIYPCSAEDVAQMIAHQPDTFRAALPLVTFRVNLAAKLRRAAAHPPDDDDDPYDRDADEGDEPQHPF